MFQQRQIAYLARTMSAMTRKPVLLPQKGTARVKSVLSGDTVVLWGKAAAPGLQPPEVQFTLEGIMSPRYVQYVAADFNQGILAQPS